MSEHDGADAVGEDYMRVNKHLLPINNIIKVLPFNFNCGFGLYYFAYEVFLGILLRIMGVFFKQS